MSLFVHIQYVLLGKNKNSSRQAHVTGTLIGHRWFLCENANENANVLPSESLQRATRAAMDPSKDKIYVRGGERVKVLFGIIQRTFAKYVRPFGVDD